MSKRHIFGCLIFLISGPLAFAENAKNRHPSGANGTQCGRVVHLESVSGAAGPGSDQLMVYIDGADPTNPAYASGAQINLATTAYASGTALCVCKRGQGEVFRISKNEKI